MLEQLGRYYRRENPSVCRRWIPPVDGPPGRQLIAAVHRAYPVSADDPPPPAAEGEETQTGPDLTRPDLILPGVC